MFMFDIWWIELYSNSYSCKVIVKMPIQTLKQRESGQIPFEPINISMQNNIRGLNDYPFSHAQMMNEVHVNWPPKSIQCNNQSTEIDGCHDNIAKAEIRVHIIPIMPLFLGNRLMQTYSSLCKQYICIISYHQNRRHYG